VDTVPPTDSTEPPPETTALPTTVGPTNTIFDPNTLEGEVEQATLANLDAFVACMQLLPACDVAFATRFALLEYGEGNARLLSDWNDEGFEARDAEDWLYEVESVEFNENRTEALAFTCSVDRSQIVRPSEDGDEVIDQGNVSEKSRYLVRNIGGRWVVTARDSIERIERVVDGYCS
jgi:hypothetical protein